MQGYFCLIFTKEMWNKKPADSGLIDCCLNIIILYYSELMYSITSVNDFLNDTLLGILFL